jgi:hypothetical protein|nr:MAG TPA: hypothetical protein [Bacteriophage sp.]
MKIIRCARPVADVKRELEQVDNDIRTKKAQYDEDHDNWRKAIYEVANSIKEEIAEDIGEVSIPLEIDVKPGFMSHGYEVTIRNSDNPHDDQALNWNWSASIDAHGDIKKESGSWSGLTAISAENIDNLKESVRVLEILNNMDFIKILSRAMPESSDYLTHEYPTNDDIQHKNSLTAELFESEMNEIMESGNWIKLKDGQGKYYRRDAYIRILSESPKMYKVAEEFGSRISPESAGYDYNIRKEKLESIIQKPFDILEV